MSAKMRTLIVLGFFLLLYFVAANMGGIFLMLPLVLLPLVFWFTGRRDVLFVVICLLYYTTLRVPLLAGQAELYHIAVAFYIVLALASSVVQKNTLRMTVPVVLCAGFGVVVVYTILLRGSGLRFLGSNLWGGFRYVDILLGLGLFIVGSTARLSLQQWRFSLVGMVCLGALPALAEVLLIFTKGATAFLYYVFLPAGQTGATFQRFGGGGMVRFTMMLQASHIYLIPYFLRRAGQLIPRKGFVFVLLAIVLGGLSGHRMVLLNVMLYVWLYHFLLCKNKVPFVLLSALLGTSGLFVLGQLAYFFPLNVQRMVSLIPFARVSLEATVDAMGTTNWRILLWKDTFAEIPRHLWLGKGFAYSVDLALAQDVRMWANYGLWWAKVQAAYHQGILSLLVGLGLPGLLTGGLFLVTLCGRHYRFWRKERLTAAFAPIHYAVLVLLLMETGIYFLVYGDVFVSFPYLCLIGAIMEGIYQSGRIVENASSETIPKGADDARS